MVTLIIANEEVEWTPERDFKFTIREAFNKAGEMFYDGPEPGISFNLAVINRSADLGNYLIAEVKDLNQTYRIKGTDALNLVSRYRAVMFKYGVNLGVIPLSKMEKI